MKGFNQNKSGGRKSGGSGRRSFGGSDRRSSGGSGRRSFGGSGRPTMHEVICDKCGEKCEVPFKPTGDKPVYCRNCFKKDEDSGSKSGLNQFKTEFDQINKKLDRIIQSLNID